MIDIIDKVFTDDISIFSNAFILGDEIHNATDDICRFIEKFPRGLVLSATLPEDLNLNINEIYKMSFADAINGGYIVDYNLWLPHLVHKGDGTTAVDVDIPIEFSKYEYDLTAKIMYLSTVMLKTGSRRCIVYLSRQEECDRFNLICKDVFENYHGLNIWLDKIDANVSSNKRRQILNEFQSGDNTVYRIISSVRILDEAIDIPLCDSVFITNVGEHTSDIRMMQRSQRSSTKVDDYKGKKNNIFLWADGWEKCIASLELLREADPNFFKKVRIADTNYDKLNDKERIEKIEHETKSAGEYINMKCMTVMDRHKMMIGKIKQFYLEYSECPRNRQSDYKDESKLAKYIIRIRQTKKKNKLSLELKELIETELPWLCLEDIHLTQHLRKITELVQFYDRYGEAPKCEGDRENESSLATYLSKRRRDKKNNKLPKELETLLATKLPWLSLEDINLAHHLKTIDELNRFHEKYSEGPKHQGVRPDEIRLATYISNRKKDKKENKLSKELENLLTEKVKWLSLGNDIWEHHLKTINLLAQFYNTFHEGPKTRGTRTNEAKLSTYICNRKKDKKDGELSKELEELLFKELPWLSLGDSDWEQHLKTIDELSRFYNTFHGPPKGRGSRPDESRLASYIQARKKDKKNNKISKELEELLLKQLPWFSFGNGIIEKHIKSIDNLSRFYNSYNEGPKNGGKRADEARLASYISYRRQSKRDGKLSLELENIIKEKLPWLKLD